MLGNVDEWCHDWYGTYPGVHVTDPWGPGDGMGQMRHGYGGVSARVRRGCACNCDAEATQVASRAKHAPGAQYSDVGFRVARTIDP